MLQQDRVADDQVRRCEAGDLVVGKVPRHDPQQNAERAAANDGRPFTAEEFDRLVGHQSFRIVGVELVDRRAEVDLAARLSYRLAHLGDDDLRELLPPFRVELADAPHERGAIGDRRSLRPLSVRLGPRGRSLPQRVVCDRRILPDRFAGRGVDNCVHARHFAPPSVGLRPDSTHFVPHHGTCGDWRATAANGLIKRFSALREGRGNGRYWARTSDPQLVELVLSQLS